MVLAPEKPPQTKKSGWSGSRVLVVVGVLIVLALAVFGLVTLLSDGDADPGGPGPVGPVGPQDSVGPISVGPEPASGKPA